MTDKHNDKQPLGYLQYLAWIQGPGGVFIEKSARNSRKRWERDNQRGAGK